MHEIDSDGHLNNLFTNGDPQAGTPATVLDAAWLNAVQTELVNVIKGAGITLEKGTNTQLLAALLALAGGGPLRVTLVGDGSTWTDVFSTLAGVVGDIVAIGCKLHDGDEDASLDMTITNDGAAVRTITVTKTFQEITTDLAHVAVTKGSELGVNSSNPVNNPSRPELYVAIQRTA